MTILTEDTTDRMFKTKHVKSIVMIGEEYCKYCTAIKPFFETMSQIYTDINFYYLPSSLAVNISKKVSYEGIPAVVSIYNGRVVDIKEGGDVDNIISLIDTLVYL